MAFGDSYTDTGNAPSSPPDYWDGRFSNGPLWIEYLAQQLGFSYNAYDNFAVSGTESNELGVEIGHFPGTSDSANVLFAIWSGNNDFANHLNIGYSDSGWDSQINSVVYSLTTASDLLYQKGARQIVIFNQLDLTRCPDILNGYPAAFRNYITGKIQIFNSRLAQAIPNLLNSHPGLQVYLLDAYSDFNYLLNNYASLGFTKATIGAVNDANLSDKSFTGPGASYIFWDDQHPTTKTHEIVMGWVASMLPTPPPPPPPPALSISAAPASGSTFIAPATVNVSAAVTSNGWPIAQVTFYVNGTLAAQASSPPYASTLSSLPTGDYTLSASLAYGSGEALTANPIQVSVAAPAGGPLPAPWQDQDIGYVGQPGSAYSNSNGTFIVSGSGNDIWDAADAFHFVYQPLTGNATLTARLTSQETTDGYAKAGLMFRQTLASNAVNVSVLITPSGGDGFQTRTATSGATLYSQGNPVAAPGWLRIQRTNDIFTAYDSTDGTNWTILDSVTNSMGATIYGGLAVCAHNNTLLSTATLDNVQVTRPVPLLPPVLYPVRGPTNFVQLNATGSIGATYVCEISSNLTNWYPFLTNLNRSGTAQFQMMPTTAKRAFFRVLLVP